MAHICCYKFLKRKILAKTADVCKQTLKDTSGMTKKIAKKYLFKLIKVSDLLKKCSVGVLTLWG